MDDKELLLLAEKEILGEAKKAAARYSIAGPSGWNPCPLRKTNKTFLVNTILHTVSSNRLRDRKKDEISKFKRKERRLLQSNNGNKGANPNNILFSKSIKNNDVQKINNRLLLNNLGKNKTKSSVDEKKDNSGKRNLPAHVVDLKKDRPNSVKT